MAKVRIREHRGNLRESLSTTFEVAGRAELVTVVQQLHGFQDITEGDIEVKPYGMDPRTGWDTHIITIKGRGVYGFSDGPV